MATDAELGACPGDGMRQAWCSRAGCDGGAKVGADCPVSMLECIACGSSLTFTEPQRTDSPAPEPDCRCGLYVGVCPKHDERYRAEAIASLQNQQRTEPAQPTANTQESQEK